MYGCYRLARNNNEIPPNCLELIFTKFIAHTRNFAT